MFTVTVTRVPGVSKQVNLNSPTSVSDILDEASVDLESSDEVRFAGVPVAATKLVGSTGLMTITRTIKSNS